MAYLNDSQIVSRANNASIELPDQVAKEVIKGLEAKSVVAALAKRVPMLSLERTQPVLNALPSASFLATDTTLKSTTTVDFDGVTLTAVPIAALVVVPDEFMADAVFPIWDEVRPLMAEAIGGVIDKAILWGTNKPSQWTSPAIYTQAAGAGNYSELAASNTDYAKGVAEAARLVAADGFNVTGMAFDNRLKWDIAASRTTDGIPLSNLTDPFFGLKTAESTNGAWTNANTRAIVGDWDKVLFGVRQQITYTIHTDAVITDNSGVVIYNAMQQDSKIMRIVGRFAYAMANPVTWMNSGSRSPFAAVTVDNSVGS